MKLAHIRAAAVYGSLSYANRRKVGCLIVLGDNILSFGYNGTPPGEDNTCEDPVTSMTLPHVLHAEDNALNKLQRQGVSCAGADVFVTTAPCERCAERLLAAGVRAVYYGETYRSTAGIEMLERAGIQVTQIED